MQSRWQVREIYVMDPDGTTTVGPAAPSVSVSVPVPVLWA